MTTTIRGSDNFDSAILTGGTTGQVLVSSGTGNLPAWNTFVANSGFTNITVFTSSGVWTIPAGVTKAKFTVVGGGGCSYGPSATSGGTSSVTSGSQVISSMTALGGLVGDSYNTPGSGGTASGGSININGTMGDFALDANYFVVNNSGGLSIFGMSHGSGASGLMSTYCGNYYVGPGGGGAGCAIGIRSGLVPGQTINITIGAGGTGSGSRTTPATAGVVVIEY